MRAERPLVVVRNTKPDERPRAEVKTDGTTPSNGQQAFYRHLLSILSSNE